MALSEFKAGDIEPFLGKTIKEIILASSTFIVYMDTEDVIQWVSDEYYQFPEKLGEIQNKISFWESVCNKVFNKNDSYDFKTLLAEGYARILNDKNSETAHAIINDTVKRIKTVGSQKIRMLYLLSSFGTTIILIVLIIPFWLCREFIISHIGINAFHVSFCSLIGGIGAFISTFIRSKSYTAEITAGKYIHILDGMLRVFYGLIAGAVLCLAIEANVILGFIEKIKSDDFSVKIFFSLIGGASETLIPSIVKKAEDQV